ncbi:MAG: DNA polymerase IV [Bacteroidota bacterium]
MLQPNSAIRIPQFATPPRFFFLLDIDCFFASVEMALNPALRNVPLCVGGLKEDRGIVSCPNYEARKYGVRTAMPLRTAARMLPPEAVFVRGHYKLYGEYSDRVMAILNDFTPDVEQVSVDEAYMDVTGCLHFWGHDPQRMAAAMQERIMKECGLSVSIGGASNRACAKIAAGVRKPAGLVIVPPGTEREFLSPLPVEAVPGIGVKTAPVLHACGIRTVGEAMARAEQRENGGGERVSALCRRIASCAVPSDEPIVAHDHVEKSISRDRTFGEDTSSSEYVRGTLYYLTERVCKTLRRDGLQASTVTVKVRFTDFTTLQKQGPLPVPSSNEEDLFAVALRLLARLLPTASRIRLVGVKASGLTPADEQLNLGVVPTEKIDMLHHRLDALQTRFGYTSIRWGITCGVAERREERE